MCWNSIYDINVIVNKVPCTLVRAKYFSQNFSLPLKKFLRAPLREANESHWEKNVPIPTESVTKAMAVAICEQTTRIDITDTSSTTKKLRNSWWRSRHEIEYNPREAPIRVRIKNMRLNRVAWSKYKYHCDPSQSSFTPMSSAFFSSGPVIWWRNLGNPCNGRHGMPLSQQPSSHGTTREYINLPDYAWPRPWSIAWDGQAYAVRCETGRTECFWSFSRLPFFSRGPV